MTYIDRVAAEIGRFANCSMDDREGRRLLRLYAVLALAKGEAVTARDVHDAWSAWMADLRPDHRSLVPFDQLSPEVQAMDELYRDAIRSVSRQSAEAP